MEEVYTIAGRRETVHKVVTVNSRVLMRGTVRCNLDQTDEEWAPRDVLASKVPASAHRCRWCFGDRRDA